MYNRTKVYIIDRSSGTSPVMFGKNELISAIGAAGTAVESAKFWSGIEKDNLCIVMGESSARLIEMLLEENGVELQNRAEGIILQWCNTGTGKVLVVSGTDEKGLMYALLELADRVRCRGIDSLFEVKNIQEYPDNKVRGVDRFVMGHRDDEWFYSEDFWVSFMQRMAKNRFNRFTLITGFDTAYMSPPYPFFVEVPGFPDVKVKDMAPGTREKNLDMLRFIGKVCKSYGIEFFFSTWQQLPWTDNQKFLVENIPITDEEFTRYCANGMREILLSCPEIDGLQLRVNLEAGIRSTENKSNTHERFWLAMIDAVASVERPVKLDLRAKGLTDEMLEYAVNTGLDIAVPTKYWCEHAALPYHIPQLRTEEMRTIENYNSRRRYSYDNLLKKPHWYDVIYRLWNYGSTNLFLWGDPDYCRRFSDSCSLGGGIGFEINTMLALKGGHEFIPGDAWPIHINPEVIDYNWEDERYWAYYLSFGRWGYNKNTNEEVWKREFDLRFGKEMSGCVEEAYRWASKVMPLITTAHFPVHPSLHYWPELYAGAALFHENNYDPFFRDNDYINSLPSDEALFYSIKQYVDDSESGELKGKYNPLQVRDWLKALADNIRKCLERIEECRECNNLGDNKELKATIVDFTMIADISEFHAWKIKAAYHLYLFRKKGCGEELKASCQAMTVARDFWAKLSRLGNEYYNHDLEFNAGTGTKRNGNWEDRLVKEIDKDIACLETLMKENGIDTVEALSTVDKEYRSMLKPLGFSIVAFADDVPSECKAGQDLVINLKCGEMNVNALAKVWLNYRHTDHSKGGYISVEMEKTADGYRAVIPGDYIVPEWDLIVFISAVDNAGNGLIYPGIYHPNYMAPYFVVKVEE